MRGNLIRDSLLMYFSGDGKITELFWSGCMEIVDRDDKNLLIIEHVPDSNFYKGCLPETWRVWRFGLRGNKYYVEDWRFDLGGDLYKIYNI